MIEINGWLIASALMHIRRTNTRGWIKCVLHRVETYNTQYSCQNIEFVKLREPLISSVQNGFVVVLSIMCSRNNWLIAHSSRKKLLRADFITIGSCQNRHTFFRREKFQVFCSPFFPFLCNSIKNALRNLLIWQYTNVFKSKQMHPLNRFDRNFASFALWN